jgi:hypothetical protein
MSLLPVQMLAETLQVVICIHAHDLLAVRLAYHICFMSEYTWALPLLIVDRTGGH